MSTAFPLWADGCIATIGSPVSMGDATIGPVTVTSGTFPTLSGSDFFKCALFNGSYANPLLDPARELVYVTARSGGTWSITKGQDGTGDVGHVSAPTLWLVSNAADLTLFATAITALETISGNGPPSTCDFRLTILTGNPAGDGDSSGGTVYLSPFIGNSISLFGGSTWATMRSAEVSIDISGFLDGLYDIFAYNASGTLTLEAGAAWASDTTRTDAIARQDGIWVKSGAHTRRLVGTCKVKSGAVNDNFVFGLHLWNAQNRIARRFTGSLDTYTTNSDTWGNTSCTVEIVQGVVTEAIMMVATAMGQGDPAHSAQCEISIGTDDLAFSPVASAQETTMLTATRVSQPVNPGLSSYSIYCRSSVDTYTVTLLQEDVTYSAVWLNGVAWV